MNIVLFFLLVVAIFLYGSEMLEPANGESAFGAKARSLQFSSHANGDADAKLGGPAPSGSDRPGEAAGKAQPSAEEPSRGPGLPLFEFEGEEPAWNIVNDTVMGGVSSSSVKVDREKRSLTFSGSVSLENNGGFASTRSEWAAYDLRRFDGIALRVRGDGNVYRLRIRTAETGSSIAYTALFPTTKDEWQEVYIPFASMVPLFRGYVVRDAGPLDPASVRSFGLMVADKQQGPFSLEVDWINAVVEKGSDIKLVNYTAG